MELLKLARGAKFTFVGEPFRQKQVANSVLTSSAFELLLEDQKVNLCTTQRVVDQCKTELVTAQKRALLRNEIPQGPVEVLKSFLNSVQDSRVAVLRDCNPESPLHSVFHSLAEFLMKGSTVFLCNNRIVTRNLESFLSELKASKQRLPLFKLTICTVEPEGALISSVVKPTSFFKRLFSSWGKNLTSLDSEVTKTIVAKITARESRKDDGLTVIDESVVSVSIGGTHFRAYPRSISGENKGAEGKIVAMMLLGAGSHSIPVSNKNRKRLSFEGSECVGKIYTSPTPLDQAKIEKMVALRPTNNGAMKRLCWPMGSILLEGKFMGFVMPRAERNSVQLSRVMRSIRDEQKRLVGGSEFWNRADLVRLALEIVMVVKSVHELPFSSLIGDICLENFLASPCNSQRRGSKQPRIWSVDCDSYHLPEFPSEMGRPVFSSRRLLLTASDNSYSDVDYRRRELEDELFAVALLLFQVLVSLGNGLPYGRAAGAQGIEFGFFPFKKEGVSGHEPKRMVGNWLQWVPSFKTYLYTYLETPR